MIELVEGELTYRVIGAAMEVHRVLGPGFLETAYQRGLEIELRQQCIAYESQRRIGLNYKGESLGDHVLDLVVEGRVVVELKAVKELGEHHRAQVISYLKAARLPVGLLLNFAKANLEHRRVVLKEALRNPRNPL